MESVNRWFVKIPNLEAAGPAIFIWEHNGAAYAGGYNTALESRYPSSSTPLWLVFEEVSPPQS